MSLCGPKSDRLLSEVGVHTKEDLRTVGVIDAYRRAKTAFPREVSLNLLWALQGALEGKPWHAVDAGTKARLKAELTNTPR